VRQVQANTMEPPSGEIDAINVHSAMRAEVRQAVAEALHELEQSVGKDLQGHSLSGNNKFQGISNDVRKEYADKLEQVYLEVHSKFNVKDSCGSDFP
jgi:hypothetical protein